MMTPEEMKRLEMVTKKSYEKLRKEAKEANRLLFGWNDEKP